MCGIVGFVDKKHQLVQSQLRSVTKKMITIIEHRGRDGHGVFIDEMNGVAFGHARLSILDLSTAAAQPFKTKDSTAVLIYNGEIYNFSELKKELSSSFNFRSSGDTEVLLRGWQKWGKGVLNRTKGMYAFGLFEPAQHTLFLALDRFGIKPLYVYEDANWFAFSSEIKAFFCLPGVEAELATEHLSEYFTYRWVAGENTLFKKIKRLEPATYLTFNTCTFRSQQKKYYEIKKIPVPAQAEVCESELIRLLENSVQQHLIADVPVGLQLSGGVDSSLIASIAIQQKKTNLHSFSIGIKRPGWNEFKYSRLVAKKLGTIHHELYFDENDFCALLPELTYHMDEPINHLHSVPMYLLSKEARKHVTVLMSGEGADEIFFGYKRYMGLTQKKSLTPHDIIHSNQFGDPKLLAKVLIPYTDTDKERSRFIQGKPRNFETILGYDMMTYLVPLLMRQDKMGMAATIENRVPFLDHELVEFAYNLPLSVKVSSQEAKIILKKVANRFLPKEIIYRPKVGFGLPQSDWLRHKDGLGRYLRFFTDRIITPRAYLNYPELQRMIAAHQTKKVDYGQLLWIMIAYELWAQIFIDGVSPAEIVHSLKNK